MGILDADHEETSPQASTLLISRLECVIAGQSQTVRLLPGTVAARAYGREEASEKFRCNFGLNPRYRATILSEPLRVAGVDANGEVRVIELANHRFLVATLYLPQLSSTPTAPHPLVVTYVEAAAAFMMHIAFAHNPCTETSLRRNRSAGDRDQRQHLAVNPCAKSGVQRDWCDVPLTVGFVQDPAARLVWIPNALQFTSHP